MKSDREKEVVHGIKVWSEEGEDPEGNSRRNNNLVATKGRKLAPMVSIRRFVCVPLARDKRVVLPNNFSLKVLCDAEELEILNVALSLTLPRGNTTSTTSGRFGGVGDGGGGGDDDDVDSLTTISSAILSHKVHALVFQSTCVKGREGGGGRKENDRLCGCLRWCEPQSSLLSKMNGHKRG